MIYMIMSKINIKELSTGWGCSWTRAKNIIESISQLDHTVSVYKGKEYRVDITKLLMFVGVEGLESAFARFCYFKKLQDMRKIKNDDDDSLSDTFVYDVDQ